MQLFQYSGVLLSRGDKVDACGFNRRMTQYIGQLCHIPAYPEKRPSEQVTKIMGEYFGGRYPRS